MRPRSLLAALALLVTVVGGASGLEVTSGKMRLDLFQSTGRFAAYYKSSAGDWTPLFYAQDPRTTVLEVKAGDSVYRMGDNSQFSTTVKKTSTGGQIAWTSSKLDVTESFSFATSSGASEADGLRVTIAVKNLTSNTVKIGMRYLIDTYLGEQNRIGFVTPSHDSMTNETEFTGSAVPAYWASPQDSKMTVALEDVMRGGGVTTPDRVIFANWKRLNDSQWSFSYDSTRNFTLLPYSINDSAVALYYDQTEVQGSAARTVTLLLGQYSANGWAAETAQASSTGAAAPAVTQLLQQASGSSGSSSTSSTSSTATTATVSADMQTVNGVLEQIQKMLDSPGSVSPSDIEVLRKVLDKLNARKAQLQGQ